MMRIRVDLYIGEVRVDDSFMRRLYNVMADRAMPEFTATQGYGVWKGAIEEVGIVTVYLNTSLKFGKIRAREAAAALATEFKQDCVLHSCTEVVYGLEEARPLEADRG